jgi:hypothetical protein
VLELTPDLGKLYLPIAVSLLLGKSVKNKLRKIFLLSVLGFGSAFGLPMDPQEVEELLDAMNRPKAEVTIPDHDDNGDGKPNPLHVELPHA